MTLRQGAWDLAAALGVRFQHRLPAALVRAGRGAVERALRPGRPLTWMQGCGLELLHVGHDTFAAADLAHRLGLATASAPPAFEAAPRGRDLTVVEVVGSADALRREGFLVLPRWVGAVVDLARLRWDGERRARARRARETMRATVVHARDGLDELYESMIVPTARARFGDRAYVPRRAFLRHLARDGWVLFVDEGGRRRGGALLVRRGRGAELKVWGRVDPGDREPSRPTVREALLVLAIDWARARGSSELSLGRSHPFLSDGPLRHKKRWGARFEADARDPRRLAIHAATAIGWRSLSALGPICVSASGQLEGVAEPALVAGRPPGVRVVHAPVDLSALHRLANGMAR